MTANRKRRIFNVAALIVAGALVSCKGAADDPQPPENRVPEASVTIVNASGRAGVCKDIAARLGTRVTGGIENYHNGDGRVDYSLTETTILCDEAFRPQAEALREGLGFGRVVEAAGSEVIEVRVGRDAPEPTFAEAPSDGVLVSKSEIALYFFEDGEITHVWPCAVGKPESPTPAGRYRVTVTMEKPTWYWQGKAIPPGPENGLGDWFIGINKKGYGIHGTNEPPSIGSAASHGCVRMYNEDAGALVKMVSPGTPVVIID
jgi:lipoprotein-anchoring transpeptidase ErfK/SrfK